MVKHGANLIRLDAFAYAVKKVDTNDFFVEPEIWDTLNEVREILTPLKAEILPEIHEHYSIPKKINDHGYFTYDFALPMTTLYTLYSGKTNQMAKWLKMSPMKQFTTLDTHDGIGVVDARDVLTDEEIEKMMKDAEANAEADAKRKEEVDLRNEVDQAIFATEKTIKETEGKGFDTERDAAQSALDDLKKAQESGNLDDMKAKLEALNEKAQALAVKLYEQAAAAQQAQAGAEGAQTADNSGDDVVDGEFTEK